MSSWLELGAPPDPGRRDNRRGRIVNMKMGSRGGTRATDARFCVWPVAPNWPLQVGPTQAVDLRRSVFDCKYYGHRIHPPCRWSHRRADEGRRCRPSLIDSDASASYKVEDWWLKLRTARNRTAWEGRERPDRTHTASQEPRHRRDRRTRRITSPGRKDGPMPRKCAPERGAAWLHDSMMNG